MTIIKSKNIINNHLIFTSVKFIIMFLFCRHINVVSPQNKQQHNSYVLFLISDFI